MNPQTLGLLDAIAGQQIKRHRSGAFLVELQVDGVTLEVTYDLEGTYLPATATDPAEYPQVYVVSVDFGSGPVFDDHARAWDERLDLWSLIGEEAR